MSPLVRISRSWSWHVRGVPLTFNLYTCRNLVKITNFTMSFLSILSHIISTSGCLKWLNEFLFIGTAALSHKHRRYSVLNNENTCLLVCKVVVWCWEISSFLCHVVSARSNGTKHHHVKISILQWNAGWLLPWFIVLGFFSRTTQENCASFH